MADGPPAEELPGFIEVHYWIDVIMGDGGPGCQYWIDDGFWDNQNTTHPGSFPEWTPFVPTNEIDPPMNPDW